MIKKIQIKNYKGIKELTTLDFELGHLKPSQIEKESTLLSKDGIKAMGVPTLIAKNASGKTSILEAIKFADSIKSHSDLVKWFTKDIIDFQEKIERSISFNLKAIRNKFEKPLESDVAKEIFILTLEKISRELSLGEIFDDSLLQSELSNEYVKQGMIRFENKIVERAKRILDHIQRTVFDNKTNTFKETLIKIEKTSGESIIIKIGNQIQFNDVVQDLGNLIGEIEYGFENGEYIEFQFSKLNAYMLYAIEECSYDELIGGIIDIKFPGTSNSLRDSSTLSRTRLINDEVIRERISKNVLESDWGGEELIKKFVNYYGQETASRIIKSVDKSISHIEGDKILNIWILKDIDGTNRAISNLSFGTFKTIFLLNQIYESWKNQSILLIDEIENGLNLSLINLIIRISTSEKLSNDGFQMIITTHNPLIFTQNIINPQNAFINVSGKFERVIDNKNLITRSEDLDKIFAPKNYFNDYFWLKALEEKGVNSNTISRDDIFELLDEIEDDLL